MIKQIKTGFRLLRYTHGIVANIALCGGVGIFGIIMSMYGLFSAMGVYLLVAAGMGPVQMLYSLGVSDMVQTSQWKKPIQTSISVMFDFLGFGAAYLISFLINVARVSSQPAEKPLAVNAMLMGGVLAAVMMVYMGFALKYFVRATIAFFVVIWGVMYATQMMLFTGVELSFGASAVIGFVCLIVGALLQYGATLLVYRKPIAKQSQLGGLKKVM